MRYFIIVIVSMVISGCQLVIINSDDIKELEETKSTVIKKEKKDDKESD